MYTHAIILDFEATCQDGPRISPQEIIEFPSVLVSLERREVIDEFQSFVRPIHHPRLTDFCKKLTSIQQEDVDKAELFPDVFQKHLAWLKSHDLTENNAFIVTCGDWDLKSGFPAQCSHSEPVIEVVPPIYQQWHNVKHSFCDAQGVEKAPGMRGMLKALELPLVGWHHRGIDDCRNIARIFLKLMEKGISPEISSVSG
ncbi:MAG: exonuclease domain-containing protein [Leptospiraceae bacterium]|nr:exonuclease domain-containing protein [Leptospiraceae bacterium]MCP5499801.1 exonuclease domain-containing protein [Leptospiraceae bacterium]